MFCLIQFLMLIHKPTPTSFIGSIPGQQFPFAALVSASIAEATIGQDGPIPGWKGPPRWWRIVAHDSRKGWLIGLGCCPTHHHTSIANSNTTNHNSTSTTNWTKTLEGWTEHWHFSLIFLCIILLFFVNYLNKICSKTFRNPRIYAPIEKSSSNTYFIINFG
jgi:hypothetical protein